MKIFFKGKLGVEFAMRPQNAKCPYCKSKNACPHLLLKIDSTFLEAQAGALFDTFQERWEADYKPDAEGFDDILAFHKLLGIVRDAADTYRDYDDNGPPGNSSGCTAFFCASPEAVIKAIEKFRKS